VNSLAIPAVVPATERRERRLGFRAHLALYGEVIRGGFIELWAHKLRSMLTLTLLMLGVLQVEDIGPFRAGFVTSRRLGRAAVRNRVRRRLRELVRRHQQEVRASFWIVVTAKSEAARANYYALEDEWLRLAKRASILAA